MITPLNMTGRIAQLVCAAAMVLAARLPARAPGKVELSLSLLGERELPDGSWVGSDLLVQPGANAERFQLTLTPARDVRVQLDARGPDGSWQQIFPAPGKEGVLAHGQSYALPGPHAFYALEGRAELRLTAAPVRAGSELPREVGLDALGPLDLGPRLPLSDGARVSVRAARLASTGPLQLGLTLGAR